MHLSTCSCHHHIHQQRGIISARWPLRAQRQLHRAQDHNGHPHVRGSVSELPRFFQRVQLRAMVGQETRCGSRLLEWRPCGSSVRKQRHVLKADLQIAGSYLQASDSLHAACSSLPLNDHRQGFRQAIVEHASCLSYEHSACCGISAEESSLSDELAPPTFPFHMMRCCRLT